MKSNDIGNISKRTINVWFTGAELTECLSSLAAISNPNCPAALISWTNKIKSSMSEKLKEELDFFNKNYANMTFISGILCDLACRALPQKLTIDETLSKMMSMDNVEFIYTSLGLSTFDYDKDAIKNWIKNPDSISEADLGVQAQFISVENARYYIKNIQAVKERVRWIINEYWENCFKEEWKKFEPYLKSEIKKEKLALQRKGVLDYLNDLHPDLKVDNNTVYFRKEPDYEFAMRGVRNIYIGITLFGDNSLQGDKFDDRLYISKNKNFHSVEITKPIDQNLFDILTACGDGTRLKIMKILWNADATTKEMAEILSLTPGTISIHLKLLKNVDLVETNRENKYVYYKLKKERFIGLEDKLLSYFQY